MSFFSSKKLYSKVLSFFVALMFLVESTILPIATMAPVSASAQSTAVTQSVSISRTPATSSASPYRVGSATTFTANASPSLFSTDQPIIVYNQIGSNPAYVADNSSTFAMKNSGFCNASTGACTIPGNWSAAQLTCPAGTTGVQQMTEWYTVGSVTSNNLTWYFECAGTSPISNNPQLSVSPTSLVQGASFTATLTGAAKNIAITIFVQQPDGTVGGGPSVITNDAGTFSGIYSTTGWNIGMYHAWVIVNGVQSNVASFTVTAPAPVAQTPSLSFSTIDTKITPSSIVLGQEVSFSTKLAVQNVTAQNVQINLDVPQELILRGAYRDAQCQANSLLNPTQQTSTRQRAGYETYIWPANYFPGGIAPGTYDFCFKYQTPASTAQTGAAFFLDASSITSTYTVTASLVNGAIYIAQTTPTVIISRTPATNASSPYRVGSATTFTANASPSLFSTDQPIIVYNQIGSNPAYVADNSSTFAMKNSGFCNASTGACTIPGNWSAAQLTCPAGTTGVQQMTEWYTVGSVTSNNLTWYFECAGTSPISNNPQLSVSPTSLVQGASFTATLTGAAKNIAITIFVQQPDGTVGGGPSVITNDAGTFSGIYSTTGWNIGMYHAWVIVNGVQSNVASFTVTAPAQTAPSITPLSPPSGPVGTSVTILGTGFTSTGNRINFGSGVILNVNSSDGRIIQFSIPSDQVPLCATTAPRCLLPAPYNLVVPGNYSVSVTNANGTSNTVQFNVTATAPASSITVLSPNGGEVWQVGTTHQITWNSTGSVPVVDITTTDIPGRYIASSISNNGSFNWAIPSDFPPGQYRLRITTPIGDVNRPSDESNASFSIVPTASTTLTISRSPLATSANPYHVGDATTLMITGIPASYFSSAIPMTFYSQTQGEAAKTTVTDTLTLKNMNICVPIASGTYTCTVQGNWSAAQFTCLDPSTPVKSLTEWVTLGSLTYNQITNYFQCSNAATIPAVSSVSLVSDKSSPQQVNTSVVWTATAVGGTNPQYRFWVKPSSATDFTLAQDYSANASFTWTPTIADNYTICVWAKSAGSTADKEAEQCAGYVITTTPPPPALPPPTPDTAPMAVLTLQGDQGVVDVNAYSACEDVPSYRPFGICAGPIPATAGSIYTFSATLNADLVSFPSDSLLWVTIPSQATLVGVVLDGHAITLGTDYVLENGNYKFVMSSLGLLSGMHSIKVALQSQPITPDYLGVLKMDITDGGLTKLFVRERTASVTVRHAVTEVVGKTILYNPGDSVLGIPPSPIQENVDVARLQVYPVPAQICNPYTVYGGEKCRQPKNYIHPITQDTTSTNIAYTLLGDTMPIYVNQFSDSLSREFILANYNFLLGRVPTDAEMNNYLPLFTQWRDPIFQLVEVYKRRTDLQQAFSNPSYQRSGILPYTNNNECSDLASCIGNFNSNFYDWVYAHGVNEEPTLAAFKENASQQALDVLRQVWNAREQAVADAHDRAVSGGPNCGLIPCPTPPPPPECTRAFAEPYILNNQYNYKSYFDSCRTMAIFWAKDKGWADPIYGSQLAPYFAPNVYPEYQADRFVRYPPATLYYEIISSPEYQQFLQKRFKTNIDSLYRVIRVRPANDSDINEQKQFMKTAIVQKLVSSTNDQVSCIFGGGGGTCEPHTLDVSGWIRDNWEPQSYAVTENGLGFKDSFYGIRNIAGEIDNLSGRLVDRVGDSLEMRTGNNFKRVLTGLYRLYLRRSPSTDEVNYWQNRMNTDNAKYHLKVANSLFGGQYQDFYGFEGIEMALNQAAEYGGNQTTQEELNNLFRNYLGRDPGSVVPEWGGKSISYVAEIIGGGAEFGSYAEKHPEAQFIFPMKKFEPKGVNFGSIFVGFWAGLVLAGLGVALGNAAFIAPLLANQVPAVTLAISQGALSQLSFEIGIASKIVDSATSYFVSAAFSAPNLYLGSSSITKGLIGLTYGVYNSGDFVNSLDNDVFSALAQPIVYSEFSVPRYVMGDTSDNTAAISFSGVGSGFGNVLSNFTSSVFGFNPGVQVAALIPLSESLLYHYRGSQQTQATSTPVVAGFAKNLAFGSRGNDVVMLQKILAQLFSSFSPRYQTGYYGFLTVATVKKLQKQYGLSPVGFVGPQTRALLNQLSR